jgi:hypothetical protein
MLSKDGKRIVTVSEDKTSRTWEYIARDENLYTPSSHEKEALDMMSVDY